VSNLPKFLHSGILKCCEKLLDSSLCLTIGSEVIYNVDIVNFVLLLTD